MLGEDSSRKMKKKSLTLKVAQLSSIVGVLAFTCGYIGTNMLNSNDSNEIEDLSETQTSICAGDFKTIIEGCFSKESRYFREFLLWKDVERKADDSWPAAMNEDEELIHSQKFHDDNSNVVPIPEIDTTSDRDGEGGRRLLAGKRRPDSSSSPESEELPQVDEGLNIFPYNRYTTINHKENIEYPWRHLVEPYRDTTIDLLNHAPTASYRWTIDKHIHGYGISINVLFTELGYHDVKVEEMIMNDDGTTTINYLVVKVMCKYVRREVRALRNIDREIWLSAVSVMQHVPTGAGQTIYGPKYFSKDHFTRLHLYYGGAMDCDHWHAGAGFVTSHIALTLQWEQALQAINPAIAAPYWDFTLESTFYGARDWGNSFVFSDDWFGEASPNNALHTVTKGRFQYVATLLDAKKFSYWVNSYGLMRAPWNNDPTPFLTRSNNVYGLRNNMKPSGCREYRVAMTKNSWMSMSRQLNSAAHGHLHELMGGAWNHYLSNIVHDDKAPPIFTFAHSMQGLSKILWRTGYMECPETCKMTDPSSDCQCQCSAKALQGKTSLEVLTETGIIGIVPFFDHAYHKLDSSNFVDNDGNPMNPIDGYTIEQTKHIHNTILGLLCNPGHIGDMFQATSTNDITFWLIHLTVDRLWHYKRLGNTNNYDETWVPYHTCYGHNPAHYQPFKDLFGEDEADRRRLDQVDTTDNSAIVEDANDSHLPGHYYTNAELYKYLHPATRVLQYVYDEFKWDHCTKIGLSFSNTH